MSGMQDDGDDREDNEEAVTEAFRSELEDALDAARLQVREKFLDRLPEQSGHLVEFQVVGELLGFLEGELVWDGVPPEVCDLVRQSRADLGLQSMQEQHAATCGGGGCDVTRRLAAARARYAIAVAEVEHGTGNA